MLKRNSELRGLALGSLKGKWGSAIVVNLVYCVLVLAVSIILEFTVVPSGIAWVSHLSSIILLPISLPLMWGFLVLFLDSYRGEKIEVGKLFDGFNDYGRIFGTTLLVYVFTILWTLLFIIPGIIQGCSYSMTSYILKDEPDLRNNAAIEKSMDMMSGNKMKLFLMDLGFLGLTILSVFTLFIGLLWLIPYWYTARAAFYEDLKSAADGIIEAV